MSGRALLLDTGALVGAVVRRDRYHAAARTLLDRVQQGTWDAAFTTDHVIVEALNYLRVRAPHRDYVEELIALVFGRDDLAPLVQDVLRIHAGRFAQALQHFRERFDQGLSMTDWTNVVCMEDARIGAIATTDAGFRGLVDEVHLLEPT